MAFPAGATASPLAGRLVQQDQRLLQTITVVVEASVLAQASTFLGKHAIGRAA